MTSWDKTGGKNVEAHLPDSEALSPRSPVDNKKRNEPWNRSCLCYSFNVIVGPYDGIVVIN